MTEGQPAAHIPKYGQIGSPFIYGRPIEIPLLRCSHGSTQWPHCFYWHSAKVNRRFIIVDYRTIDSWLDCYCYVCNSNTKGLCLGSRGQGFTAMLRPKCVRKAYTSVCFVLIHSFTIDLTLFKEHLFLRNDGLVIKVLHPGGPSKEWLFMAEKYCVGKVKVRGENTYLYIGNQRHTTLNDHTPLIKEIYK